MAVVASAIALVLGIGLGAASGSQNSSKSADTVTITNGAGVGGGATETVTETETQTQTDTQTVTAAASSSGGGNHSSSGTALVIRGNGTEKLPPFNVAHSGEMLWSCPSCGQANFIVEDPNFAIAVNSLNRTHGKTYVDAGHYSGVSINTEGGAWTLKFLHGK